MKTQHLTASDLMVGDWVRINYRNKVVQVTEIVDKAIGTTAISPLSEDEFEPILLTPEILEKNGFTKELRLYYWVQEKDGETTAGVYYWVDEKYVNIAGYEDDGVTISCPYVHILQHALKICGIDKNIKL